MTRCWPLRITSGPQPGLVKNVFLRLHMLMDAFDHSNGVERCCSGAHACVLRLWTEAAQLVKHHFWACLRLVLEESSI